MQTTTITPAKRGTPWSVMGFQRAACYGCDWNRTEHGEPQAGDAAKACAHADESGHRTFIMQRRVREFRPRP